MIKICASKTDAIEKREIEHMNISRELAGECMVLLENDGALPIKKIGKIALYGNGVRHTVRGGTGSGDVNTRSNTNIEQGFINSGFEVTTKEWLDRQDEKFNNAKNEYAKWSKEKAESENVPEFKVQFDYPFHDPTSVLITENDVEVSDTDTAVFVITRNSGEGADRFCKEGDYLLYEEEKQNLELLAKSYDKTIVVLNIGGVMDMTAINSISGINAVLLMTQLGNLGGDALVDVITGKSTPCGKTADTWAKDYMDYPSSAQFSHNGSVHDEEYTDGIFMGYRYFDSFMVEPEYCFGYGKSYTDFAISTDAVSLNGSKVELKVAVQNIGKMYAGKEVVQVYYSAPDGELAKPYQELIAFKKTDYLVPCETENIVITFDIRNMASYSEKEAAWILEKGDYIIRVGNSSANTTPVAVITVGEDKKTQIGKNLFKLDCPLTEIEPDKNALSEKKASGIAEDIVRLDVKLSDIETVQIKYQEKRQPYTTDKDKTLTIQDVKSGNCTVEELVAQLTVDEMAQICVGTLRADGGSIVGNASSLVPGAAGDTSSVIMESRGVKNMILADGPAGLRLQPHFKTTKDGTLIKGGSILGDVIEPFETDLKDDEIVDYYQYCTAIPIGWALAQSWNEELVSQAGDMVGSEMEQFNVDLWLAPAMNIHRNPLCGRNFEYYSEDPLVAGKMAAAMTNGVQKHPGKGTTIKHFAVNNQEDNRYFVNAHVSERALREIYLKGFEITVRESQPLSIMTSYNLLNGIHTANSHDLLQGMARDEWGFEGTVMTDWFTSQHMDALTNKFEAKYPISASTGCIYAGNDIQMPGCQKNVDDIVEAVNTGKEIDGYTITLADLQYNAANVIRVVVKTI
jgi:beta-glucosidase